MSERCHQSRCRVEILPIQAGLVCCLSSCNLHTFSVPCSWHLESIDCQISESLVSTSLADNDQHQLCLPSLSTGKFGCDRVLESMRSRRLLLPPSPLKKPVWDPCGLLMTISRSAGGPNTITYELNGKFTIQTCLFQLPSFARYKLACGTQRDELSSARREDPGCPHREKVSCCSAQREGGERGGGQVADFRLAGSSNWRNRSHGGRGSRCGAQLSCTRFQHAHYLELQALWWTSLRTD